VLSVFKFTDKMRESLPYLEIVYSPPLPAPVPDVKMTDASSSSSSSKPRSRAVSPILPSSPHPESIVPLLYDEADESPSASLTTHIPGPRVYSLWDIRAAQERVRRNAKPIGSLKGVSAPVVAPAIFPLTLGSFLSAVSSSPMPMDCGASSFSSSFRIPSFLQCGNNAAADQCGLLRCV